MRSRLVPYIVAAIGVCGIFLFQSWMPYQVKKWIAEDAELNYLERQMFWTHAHLARYWYITVPVFVASCFAVHWLIRQLIPSVASGTELEADSVQTDTTINSNDPEGS